MEQINTPTVLNVGEKTEGYVPRKMTFVGNAILTINLVAIAAAIVVAFWGVEQWTGAK